MTLVCFLQLKTKQKNNNNEKKKKSDGNEPMQACCEIGHPTVTVVQGASRQNLFFFLFQVCTFCIV